jgi:hypothetical protein
MNFLILGDFSAVNLQLWKGLDALGHQVAFYSRGDSFKSIPAQNIFYVRKPSENRLVGVVKEVYNQLKLARTFKGYDAVITSAQIIFHNRLNTRLMRSVRRNNSVLITQAMACSTAYHRFVQTLKYSPCTECALFDHKGVPCIDKEYENATWDAEWYNMCDAIVGPGYEYYEGMRQFVQNPDSVFFIPFPVDLNDYPVQPLADDFPIRIFYGKNRDGFKGSRHIRPALKRIQEMYGERVQVNMPDRLPFDEYKRVVREAHIVVDQCNSYTYGMNAVLSMAQGKVVLTGAEPETLALHGISEQENPLVNIVPDEEQIFQTVAALIEAGPQAVVQRGLQSRTIAERVHDNRKVAQQYVELVERLQATSRA